MTRRGTRIGGVFILLAAGANSRGAWSDQGASTTEGGRPCVSEPEIGASPAAEVKVALKRAGGDWKYSWVVSVKGTSRVAVERVAIDLWDVPFEDKKGWRMTPGRQEVAAPRVEPDTRRGAVSIATAIDSHGKSDIERLSSGSFDALSPKLPGVTLMRLYPRRQSPCLPTTEEEKRALTRVGWSEERFGAEFEKLTHVDFYTSRELVVGPVFPPESLRVGPAGLFAAAMSDLAALEDYLAIPVKTDTYIPPPLSRGANVTPTSDSLETIRGKVYGQKNFREVDRPIVEQLFGFYAKMREEAGKGASR